MVAYQTHLQIKLLWFTETSFIIDFLLLSRYLVLMILAASGLKVPVELVELEVRTLNSALV